MPDLYLVAGRPWSRTTHASAIGMPDFVKLIACQHIGGQKVIDQITHQNSSGRFIAATSDNGRLLLGESNDPDIGLFLEPGWSGRSCRGSEFVSVAYFPVSSPLQPRGKIFGWPQFSSPASSPRPNGSKYSHVIVPYWLLILSTAAITITPWLRWPTRFSLRTLLIATTLVALLLGLIMSLR